MGHNLIGEKIRNSKQIQDGVDHLVKEWLNACSAIEGVRPPQADAIENGKSWVDKTGQKRGRPLFYPYVGTGAGHGVYVELEDGSVKMDLINGIGIHLMGHGHPEVLKATVRGALSDIVVQGNLQPNREYFQFSEKLVALASRKSRLKYAWLATCGTMANESALKITRQKHTPARKVFAFKDAFAGRSTMMAEITDNPAYKQGLPSYDEVLRIPFYDPKYGHEKTLAAMKELWDKNPNDISAFVFEPMLGEGGYRRATRDFFVPLLEFCKEKKIAVWADEIQTFTRTGEIFAFETLDIGNYIDICTIAKTAQVGATLYTEEYNPQPGLIAGTFSGSSAALSAGTKILEILSEQNYLGPKGRINEIHERFIGMLNNLNETSCKSLLLEAGGMGLMIAVTPLDGSKAKVDALLKRLFNNGLMAFGCGKDPFRIRFLVPAVMKNEDIEAAKKIIEKSILEEAKA